MYRQSNHNPNNNNHSNYNGSLESSSGASTSSSGSSAMLAEALKSAVLAGDVAGVLDLLNAGAPLVIDADGQTALHIAASAGHLPLVDALIQAGCDVAVQDFTGHTSLQRAAAEGHLEVVKALVKNGVAVDHQDEVHGNTALHESAWKGYSQTTAFLCKSKANPYIKNRGGFAPLHLCCQNGHNETCRVLLISGCKPDIKNNYGDTPLHTAARYGHAGVIRILVSAKCNTSEQNKNGDTALHISAAMGRRKLTRLLLESGCDKRVRNKQHETAADIAQRKQLAEIYAILRNFEQQPSPVKLEQLGFGKSVDDSDDVDAIRPVDGYPHQYGNNPNNSHNNKQRYQQQQQRKSRRVVQVQHHQSNQKQQQRNHQYPRFKHHRDCPSSSMEDNEDENEIQIPIRSFLNEPEEAFFVDLSGKIRKGPVASRPNHLGKPGGGKCSCVPVLLNFEKRLDRDKREILRHIDLSKSKLDLKLAAAERRTKDQIFGLNQAMRETFAQERSECLDRMDRRAVRERVALERSQMARDMKLKRDIALWLDSKLNEIEKRHKLDARNASQLRKIALKRLAKRAGIGSKQDILDLAMFFPRRKGQRLRRARSEEAISEIARISGDEEDDFEDENNNESDFELNAKMSGLMVSDRPAAKENLLRKSPSCKKKRNSLHQRQRRNSAGDEIQSILDFDQSNKNEEDLGGGSSAVRRSLFLRDTESPLATSETLCGDDYDQDGVEAGDLSFDNGGHELRISDTPTRTGWRPSHFDNRDLNNSHLVRPIPHHHHNGGRQQPQPQTTAAPVPPPKPAINREQLRLNEEFNKSFDFYNSSQQQMQQLNYQMPQQQLGAYNNNVFLPTRPLAALKPILTPLEEVDYISAEQLKSEGYHSANSGGGSNAEDPSSTGTHREAQAVPQFPHNTGTVTSVTSSNSDGGGSHDSHNDSGYSTRLGFSAGPSPSLSGSRPGSGHSSTSNPEVPEQPIYQNQMYLQRHSNNNPQPLLLDPSAINNIPPEFEVGPHHHIEEGGYRLPQYEQAMSMNGLPVVNNNHGQPYVQGSCKGSLV